MRDHLHPELQGLKYVVFADASRRYTDCSDGVCELVGYDRNELLKLKIEDLSFNTTSVLPLFEKYRQERQQKGEFILRHKNGTPVVIRYASWVFEDGCHAAAWQPADEWEHLYLAALIETDPIRLREKVNSALTAIQERQRIAGDPESAEVRQKLRDAREALRTILS